MDNANLLRDLREMFDTAEYERSQEFRYVNGLQDRAVSEMDIVGFGFNSDLSLSDLRLLA